MRTETREILLPVSAETACAFLADYRNAPLWHDELTHAELLSGEPGEQGARFAGRIEWYGSEVRHELEMAEIRCPGLVHLKCELPDARVSVRYVLEPGGRRSTLLATYRLELDGPLVILEPFAWAVLTGWVNDDLPNLPVVLAERNAVSAGDGGRLPSAAALSPVATNSR